MTQYFSGDETVRRERLLDTVMMRAAYKTPLISRLPHESTSHVITEWPLDEPFPSGAAVRTISAPHADARREGAAWDFVDPTYQVKAKTICEIKHHGMEMSATDRSARLAGVDNTWDYRSGQLFTRHLNSIDNTLMYGLGSPETSGKTDERRTQGLISNAAWTGLERMHGSGKTEIEDAYGVLLPSTMWSVYYNANHSNLTLDMFYNNLVVPARRAGADMETTPWIYMCGDRVMGRIARFMIADGGVAINDRNQDANNGMGNDYLHTFRLANGLIASFRTNIWLDQRSQTYSIGNTDYTPGSPTAEGSIAATTFYGDQTVIGYEPGTVKILWYREPGFRDADDGNGDYSRVACVSEFALQVDHPLCVAGIGNCLS